MNEIFGCRTIHLFATLQGISFVILSCVETEKVALFQMITKYFLFRMITNHV